MERNRLLVGLRENFIIGFGGIIRGREAWSWQNREEYGNRGQGSPAIDGDRRTMWIFEPKVAEMIFESWVKENQLQVFRDEWLDREKGVQKEGGKIISITTLAGNTYQGEMFLDCTYEGDLLAAAGVSILWDGKPIQFMGKL